MAAPRVVHNLPGRVRIHFPALKRLSSHWHRYSAPVAELVKIKRGIQNTSIQPMTGSVLITYDADTLGQKEVLNWLESIATIFTNNLRDYTSLSEHNFESLLNRVKIELMDLEK
ncbi:MAG: hypothetical protein PVH37_04435 [Desulfobacterales bacterium]